MLVNANLETGYQFILSDNDEKYMSQGFKSSLVSLGVGMAFLSQEYDGDYLISGVPFVSVAGVPIKASKTYAPKTKHSALIDHKLTVDAEFGSIVSIASASKPKPYHWIKSSGSSFYANHIPQLNRGFMGSFISGVNGVYNWRSNSFSGFISVG